MVRQLAVDSPQDPADEQYPMEFTIFCGNKDLDGTILQGVAFDAWVQYNDATKVWYSSTGNMLPVLQQQIAKEKPAYLFITGLYDWQYNGKPLLFCKGVKKIISVRGMLHPGALSQKGLKKKIYLGLWRLLGLHTRRGSGQGATIFHATDEAECHYIKAVFGKKTRVLIAANFPNALPVQPVQEKQAGQLKLASIALISPMKHILRVLEALSSWQKGNIEYHIYGPVKDKAYWVLCEAQIQQLPPTVTVHYHGDLQPADIAGALGSCHVFILPSRSENFGHSLYEALSAGRPVITSNNTPWNQLQPAKAGINVDPDKLDELQQAIGFFAVMEQAELEQWSAAARSYAEKAVDVEQIRRQHAQMFGEGGRG